MCVCVGVMRYKSQEKKASGMEGQDGYGQRSEKADGLRASGPGRLYRSGVSVIKPTVRPAEQQDRHHPNYVMTGQMRC